MLRSPSYVVTGSEDHHKAVHAKILQHERDIAPCMVGHIKSYSRLSTYSSMDEYLQQNKMDRYAWGMDLELLTFVI